jgi:hypothetical protein
MPLWSGLRHICRYVRDRRPRRENSANHLDVVERDVTARGIVGRASGRVIDVMSVTTRGSGLPDGFGVTTPQATREPDTPAGSVR